MSLMGSFYVGVSGLQTSQNALNTTAHNLANIDTTGFTRQQVYQGTRPYNTIGQSYNSPMQLGMGVAYSDVRAVRDYFMDQAYRTESGRAAYYSTNNEVINEITTLFGEMQGVAFQESVQTLRNSFMNLANKPTDATVQGDVIQSAAQFLYRAQAVYNGMSEYQDNLNEQIKDQVDTINDYADKIAKLNEKISTIVAGGIESPNDLMDARNQLLDELSAYGRISYHEDGYSNLNILFEGVGLVSNDRSNHISLIVKEGDRETGFYTPVWANLADQEVFNAEQEISADAGTDSGSLKALYFARGNIRAEHKDMKDKDGALNQDAFDKVSVSALNTIMCEFDNLVNGIVTEVNKLLTKDYETDADGNLKYQELFMRIQDGDEYDGAVDADGNLLHDFTKYYTTSNLMINAKLMNQPTLLNNAFILENVNEDGSIDDTQSADQETADKLSELFQGSHIFSTLNPETTTPLSFEEYYSGIVEQYATLGNAYQLVTDAQEQLLVATENKRQEVMGVSDNEELTKMIRFQNAYNASSRFFNTVNDMLTQMMQQLGA